MLNNSHRSTYLSDMDADFLYASHLSKMDKIYKKSSLSNKLTAHDQISHDYARCKAVHNDFSQKELLMNRKAQNYRIFKSISDIQKRTNSVTSIHQARDVNQKSLNKDLINRKQAAIDRENTRI